MGHGAHVLTREQVMEGVPEMIPGVQVEATVPDGTVAPPPGPPHDPAIEAPVTRLEGDASEIKATLRRLEPMIVRMDAVIPHLATRADLEVLRGEMRAGLAALVTQT